MKNLKIHPPSNFYAEADVKPSLTRASLENPKLLKTISLLCPDQGGWVNPFGNGALNRMHQRNIFMELRPKLSRTFQMSFHYQYR